MEIISEGLVENEDQIVELSTQYGTIIIPNAENLDLELTHYWVIRENGEIIIYVGTPETFAGYIEEINGIQ